MAVFDGWEVLENYVHLFPDKLADGRSRKSIQNLYKTRFGSALPVYSPVTQWENVERNAPETPPEKVSVDTKGLSAEEKTVLGVIGTEPTHSDVIIERSAMAPARVLATLTMLQIKGKIVKLGGNCYKTVT